MKRLFMLILAFTMFAISAFGEGVELSAMSLDELQALHEQLDAEIKTRLECETSKGYSGVLIGGKNIELGAYVLTCVGTARIYIWLSESSYALGFTPDSVIRLSDGENAMVYFEEETHVVIDDGRVLIQPAAEDWVPKTAE